MFQDVGFRELAIGGWGNQGKRRLAEPGGATAWTLFINDNSKNPYVQSSVREIGMLYGASGFLRATHYFAKILEAALNFAS